MSIEMKFHKLSENATTPSRGSDYAAGLDLYSAEEKIVPAKGRALIKTDIQVALPDGCYGRIAPRSGLAYKKGIDVGAGVVDQDYRGNVGVILFNFGEEEFKVEKGDRIAQFILERIWMPVLVESSEKLEETVRGEAGFGSTGVKKMKLDNEAENRQPLVENKN
ncbi:Oidioi.mRNA.OKI2018_I69.chr2.g7792.t1.cds [Oikopleura dioica]|uniref:Deoxyuridine 5'-triphosphate nucleotidohydrolase n=1 Tax=Oikopleura dioica TaxID=34765 RepID=A0ABN7TAR3_OIKDI|nr:Oidioi.mRNA.OKI2018_I69.chr2.g7792.t1.cds [Oikopleura dioica]